MARAAYRRALRLREGNAPVAGVACTATIATDRPKRGEHRCHVAYWTGAASAVFSLTFVKGLRDRAGEDAVASRLTLNRLRRGRGRPLRPPARPGRPRARGHRARRLPRRRAGPGRRTRRSRPRLRQAAAEADAPVRGGVLPGSFNPLHRGHRSLADAASRILGEPVTFELSITNVDKPPLAETEIRRRLAQFDDTEAVAVTRTPVFYRKADLFPGCAFVIGWDTATRLVDPATTTAATRSSSPRSSTSARRAAASWWRAASTTARSAPWTTCLYPSASRTCSRPSPNLPSARTCPPPSCVARSRPGGSPVRFRDVREFASFLESKGDLRRVSAPVSRDLGNHRDNRPRHQVRRPGTAVRERERLRRAPAHQHVRHPPAHRLGARRRPRRRARGARPPPAVAHAGSAVRHRRSPGRAGRRARRRARASQARAARSLPGGRAHRRATWT